MQCFAEYTFPAYNLILSASLSSPVYSSIKASYTIHVYQPQITSCACVNVIDVILINCGTWWRFGRVDHFRAKGHGFDSRSSRQVGTFGKFLTHNCLWRFGVKFRHSIRSVSGAPLRSRGLEEAL